MGYKRFKLKKFRSVSARVFRLCAKRFRRARSLFLLAAAARGAASIRRLTKVIAEILDYGKKFHIENPAGSRRIDFDTRLPSSDYFRGRRTKRQTDKRDR
jgi:hypothetical protein